MSRARKPAAPNAAGAEALVCTPRMLPRSKWVAAARNAVDVNPVNHPPIERLGLVQRGLVITHERIAVLTTKYWGAARCASPWASSTYTDDDPRARGSCRT